jgi:eukaryotic-like serine/threonine-protein kinase
MELEQGKIVAGRYRLERRIGVGGMGEVWSATQTVTRKPVALKFLRDAASEKDVRRRFLREARAACAVRHPNVVQITTCSRWKTAPRSW